MLSAPTVTYIDSRARRVTMESAYLTPDVLARPNLNVVIRVQVTKILFSKSESDENLRATGVLFTDSNGEAFEVKARREVIVSCVCLDFACKGFS